jgi:hypothetical protein
VAEDLQVGDLLNVDLSRDDAVLLTILASVVRAAAGAEGGRVVGCNFIRELSEQQVQALL